MILCLQCPRKITLNKQTENFINELSRHNNNNEKITTQLIKLNSNNGKMTNEISNLKQAVLSLKCETTPKKMK